MDGRWKRWVCAGLVAGAVGCNRNAVQPPEPPGLPAADSKPSLLQTAFGNHPTFKPQAPPSEPVVTKPRKPGEPIKPETEVELAAAEVEGAFMEGRSAVDRDKLLDTARQRYQRALKADPKNKGALVGLAHLYAKCGDKDQAVATFRAALKASPKDHELAHEMAAVQVQFEDWEGAARTCQYALSLDPENRTYHRTLGYCQAQLGRWQEAGETLMKVMPEAKVRYFLGRVLIDQNRMAEGRQMIQQAAALDPQFETAKDFLAELDGGRPRPKGDVRQATFDANDPDGGPGTVPAHER
jgi:tetratricopeptide (TPR) repeat protein